MRTLGMIAGSILLLSHAGCALDRAGIGGSELDAAVGWDAGGGERDGGSADGSVPAIDGGGGSRTDGGTAARDGGSDAGLDAGTDAGPPPLCPPDPALVACYPFDGDANDHGPRGNHLSASSVDWEPGGGVALSMSSGLSIAHRAELAYGQTTLVGWMRADVIPGSGRSGVVDHDGRFGIFVHPGGELRCSIASAGSLWASAASAVQPGTWHHVACVAGAEALRLYLDGAMVASVTAAPTLVVAATPLHVGENAPTGDDQLVGAVDDLRIWDAVWSDEDIAADARRRR